MFEQLRARWWRRLMWAGLRRTTQSGDEFLTFHARPKRAEAFATRRDASIDVGPVAIVMQGPIAAESDFTLETLRLYRRQFGDCHLILSTWAGTPETDLTAIRALGVEVLLCQKPAEPGLFNVNMQIVTASEGVRRAVGAGAKWVLKTRTDQRLCDPNAMNFLAAVVMTFPVVSGFSQKHRIVGIGQGTLKYALYHLTDQTVFGHADDMLRYWTPSLREEPPPGHWPGTLAEICSTIRIGELNRCASAETYFASDFLQRLGRNLAWTLEDSWAAFRDHFCVVDYAATDFYWIKGQQYTWRELPVEYDRVSNRSELAFRDWLLLYSGLLRPEAARLHEGILGETIDWPRPDIAFR